MIAETIAGVAVAAALLGIRRAVVKQDFLDRHKRQILEENEEIVESWRASDSDGKRLLIERRFKPPGINMPTITVKRTYRRDPWR